MIIGKQSGLGRGLGALIPQRPTGSQAAAAQTSAPSEAPSTPAPVVTASTNPATPKPIVSGPPKPRTLTSSLSAPVVDQKGTIHELPISSIEANPQQPRKHFDHAMLDDLIASVKEHGIIQPLLVTKKSDGKYYLIAGERRLRAATLAGLTKVPVTIRDATEQQRLELALIENIQRQDLNAIEEAKSYEELQFTFGLTQDEIAKKVGKSRSQIANTMRLLQLPEAIQQALMEGAISASNGRTLLALESETERERLFEAMIAGRFTVREAEERVKRLRTRTRQTFDSNIRAAEEQIRSYLSCKVKVRRGGAGDGEIRLRFYSDEELKAILDKLHS